MWPQAFNRTDHTAVVEISLLERVQAGKFEFEDLEVDHTEVKLYFHCRFSLTVTRSSRTGVYQHVLVYLAMRA